MQNKCNLRSGMSAAAIAFVLLVVAPPLVSATQSTSASKPQTPASDVKPGAGEAQRIDRLLERLASNAARRTPFVEQRESALLTGPVTLRGHLERETDGSLVRRVDSPWVEEARINRERVLLVRDGRRRSFALSRAPELVDVLTAFDAILAGDRAPLSARYRLSLVETGPHWKLQFVPIANRNLKKRRRVALTVHGFGDQPRCVVTEQSDGAVSRMLMGSATTSAPTIEQAFTDFCANAGN